MKTRDFAHRRLTGLILRALVLAALITPASSVFANDNDLTRHYRNSDLKGAWTMTGWVEATLLVPFPAEITHSVGPGDPVNPGDKVALKGALVGLFEFNGFGEIVEFNDLFKPGGIEPMSPPFPIPWVPPFPEFGHGSYTVSANGMVLLSTEIIDPGSGNVAGELDYNCVLNRNPKRLDCIPARFTTYVVDPAGYNAPITGQITMMPQR